MSFMLGHKLQFHLALQLLTTPILDCYQFAVEEPDEMEKTRIVSFSIPTKTNKFWRR